MNRKSIVLVAFAVVSFLGGLADQYFYPGEPYPPTTLVEIVVGALLIFAWYRIDSDQRGFRRSPLLNIGVIGLAILAMPYYLFRSRGAKGGFIATGAALGVYVASVVLSLAGGYTAYFGLQT